MKKWSVKRKVTLWYTVFMTLLVLLMLFILFFVGRNQLDTTLKANMQKFVAGAVTEAEYEDGVLEVDEELDFFWNGIYLSVYDKEGRIEFGRVPGGVAFEDMPYFKNNKIQEFTVQGETYLVYDLYSQTENEYEIWVRAVASKDGAESGLGVLVKLAAVIFPFLVILIAVGGYFVTKRALRPVNRIRRTAEEIARGGDLSKRIRLGNGDDEIYQLADTFDYMLDRLEDSFRREKQFTSDASHELRTPVSVILAQSEYALRNAEELEEAKDSLQVVHRQAKKMSGLISQLLTLARADSGRLKPNMEHINLSELLDILIQEQAEKAGEKGIRIHSNLQSEIMLYGDETMLMRIFINLLQNAISYGKENGNIWVILKENEKEVQAYVRDDGIGIAPDKLERIWERFYQVDPSRERKESGSVGLGLPMVKWMTEAHGGTVKVKSEPGKGSEFILKVPKNK